MNGIVNGANLFKNHLVKKILTYFNAKRVLDMCSGWGDRLIGSMGTQSVERYLSFDPNHNLIPGYEKIMQLLTSYSKSETPIYETQFIPFENSIINEKFDLAFTSPPFFDLEIYSDESTQSIETNNTLQTWLNTWYFNMLQKAYDALEDGGHIAIYINDSLKSIKDSSKEDLLICEPMLNFMTTLPDVRWVGVVGIQSETPNKFRPLWVWRKGQIKNGNQIPLYSEL
jgi:tRNA1(Val) A37 N6-methylase TrmN6